MPNGEIGTEPLIDSMKKNSPLRLRKMFYEFYTAPVTKFWVHSVSIYLNIVVELSFTQKLLTNLFILSHNYMTYLPGNLLLYIFSINSLR